MTDIIDVELYRRSDGADVATMQWEIGVKDESDFQELKKAIQHEVEKIRDRLQLEQLSV